MCSRRRSRLSTLSVRKLEPFNQNESSDALTDPSSQTVSISISLCREGDNHFFFSILGAKMISPKPIFFAHKHSLFSSNQQVLKLYSKELPDMNYTSNTRKQSAFLERCVSKGYYILQLSTLKTKCYKFIQPIRLIEMVPIFKYFNCSVTCSKYCSLVLKSGVSDKVK